MHLQDVQQPAEHYSVVVAIHTTRDVNGFQHLLDGLALGLALHGHLNVDELDWPVLLFAV